MIALSEEQTDVRDVVRGVLGRVRRGDTDRLWSSIVELGLTGVPFPESRGGAGGTWKDAGVVVETLGEALGDAPYLSSVGMAGAALLYAGNASAAAPLRAVADGAGDIALVGLATDFASSPGTATSAFAVSTDGRVRVTGQAATAFGVQRGGRLLVAASADDGPVLVLIPTDGPGVAAEELTSLDLGRPLWRISMDGAAGEIVGGGAGLVRAWCVIHALVAAEQLGIAEHCVAVATEYAGAREQFGRPIGSFQAIKHLIVDMHVATELARPAVLDALSALDDGRGVDRIEEAVLTARALVGAAAAQTTAGAIQVHGGIGFTFEHELHRYYRRALTLRLVFGSEAQCHRRLGAAALRPPTPG